MSDLGTDPKFTVAYVDAGDAGTTLESEVVRAAGGRLLAGDCRSDDDVVALAGEADAVLCRHYRFHDGLFGRLPGLKALSRSGVGYDNVDVDAATEHGVAICNVVDYGHHEVANHAFALLLGLNRKIVDLDRRLRRGETIHVPFQDPPAYLLPTGRIFGQTLGLLGFGRIAQEMARRAQGFGLRVLAVDPWADPTAAEALQVELTSLDRVLAESDYLSVHAPLSAATRGMIGQAQLAAMKPSAYLILTARGGIVDEAALVEALRTGQVAGAGIDTWATEPVRVDDPLLGFDNVIATPHSAFYSEVSITVLRERFAEATVDVCLGRMPRSLVNPAVLSALPLAERPADEPTAPLTRARERP